jgi:hypothetical protein
MELTGPNCNAHDDSVWSTVIATMPSHHRPLVASSSRTATESTPLESESEFVATRC